MTTGVNSATGAAIEGIAELQQRIGFCLRTRVGTMPAPFRDFGSDLPNLIDNKINDNLTLEIFVATADALAKPINGFTQQIKLLKTVMTKLESGIELLIEGILLISGEKITLEGVKIR